jgi:cephalosporin hydroxylase
MTVMEQRYAYYRELVGSVSAAIQLIQEMPQAMCFDQRYIELEIIPKIGLNNEMLSEQPSELNAYFGTGLHLWQYPNQFSKYLVWLAYNARDIKSYMEVGCRWGGTFIIVMEWLKKIGCDLNFGVAVDPIPSTPFIAEYMRLSSIPILYYQGFSNSDDFKTYHSNSRPDMVFVDGDHSMFGVMNDHLLVRETAKIIVHHDVVSVQCPDTTLFWNYVKNAESEFSYAEFLDQYESVNGSFLGIGVLRRK